VPIISKTKAKVWKFGDNIDTDLIIAARYLSTSDPMELAKHVMEDAGSSREHAPKSFARIFYRNAFNMGLPIFELPQSDEIKEGDEIDIDMENGEINNGNKTYKFTPIPPFMQELIASGGLINFAKKEMK